MQDQSDFLVVGVIGKQGVGKSTVMSLLAGTRTGAGKYVVLATSYMMSSHHNHYQLDALHIANIVLHEQFQKHTCINSQRVLCD